MPPPPKKGKNIKQKKYCNKFNKDFKKKLKLKKRTLINRGPGYQKVWKQTQEYVIKWEIFRLRKETQKKHNQFLQVFTKGCHNKKIKTGFTFCVFRAQNQGDCTGGGQFDYIMRTRF